MEPLSARASEAAETARNRGARTVPNLSMAERMKEKKCAPPALPQSGRTETKQYGGKYSADPSSYPLS